MFEYQKWMTYTWSYKNEIHQIDPLSYVPNIGISDASEIPLYKLINMPFHEAVLISKDWRLMQLRKERDRLISETDWWVLPDIKTTQAQLDYRQLLRDITENFDPEKEIIFPSKPTL